MKTQIKYIIALALTVLMAAPAFVFASTGKATIINPTTGEKRVINIGQSIPPGFTLLYTQTVQVPVTTTPTATKTSLGDLVILDQLFNGNNALGVGNTSSSNLGDLFMLNQLFGGGGTLFNSQTGAGSTNLGNLFVLDRLFSGNGILNNGGILGSGTNNLGGLFVLDQLFGTSGGLFK